MAQAARPVLVTGASGLTGSQLCRELIKRGHHVRAMVRALDHLDALEGLNVELAYGDLTLDLADDLTTGVETVYHLAAAYETPGGSRQDYFEVNAEGTSRLLRAASNAKVGRFVHCSSAGVLGDTGGLAADETTTPHPADDYQASKLEGERRALAFGRQQGLPVVVVRPARIYGPGELSLLPLFLAIEAGWHWRIGSGENLCHLVYIDDLVQGILLAGGHPAAVGETFMLAGERPVPVKGLLSAIAKVLHRPNSRGQLPARSVWLAAQLLEQLNLHLGMQPPLPEQRLRLYTQNRAYHTTKARRILNYEPQVDLLSGLARTLAWYRQYDYL